MAGANYAKFAATAERMIRENGRLASARKLDSSPSDPAKPWAGSGSPKVEFIIPDLWVVFSPISNSILRSGLGRTVIDDQLNKKREQLALIAPVDPRLEFIDEIIDTDGVIWRIDTTQILRPALTTILFYYTLER